MLDVSYVTVAMVTPTANAAKEELVPYFGTIIETLKVFLTPTSQEEAQLKVQVQALGQWLHIPPTVATHGSLY